MLPEPSQSITEHRSDIMASDTTNEPECPQEASQIAPDDDPAAVETDPSHLSTATRSEGSSQDALDDDDQRWIETVVASLQGRSRAAQEALAKALVNGEAPATEGSRGKPSNWPAPVGCANSLKPLNSKHLSDEARSKCSTTVYHKGAPLKGLTDCPHEDLSHAGCHTTDGGRRSSSLSHDRSKCRDCILDL